MSKKPASLTSDLLARKGEAGPSSVDPVSRVTLSPGRQSNLSGIGTNEGPSPGLYNEPATERPEMYGTDEEERPSPPEPEIIYTPEDESGRGSTRLIAGAFVGIAILGGILVALSLNDGGSGVAPVSPEVTAQPEEAPAPQTQAPQQSAEAPAAPAETVETAKAEATVPASEEPAQPPAEMRASTEPAAPESKATPPAAEEESGPTSIAPPASAPEAAKPAEAAPQERAAAEAAKPAATAAVASGGAYVVQIMALREEAAAKSAWATLQKKHPSILGGHALDVEKADLGDKGVFYRVRAAGFETKAAAQSACSSLKAAGQDCLVKSR